MQSSPIDSTVSLPFGTNIIGLPASDADLSRLVATLGSKSTLKKVTRKAILDVDIPKACDTIVDPETPLALRLQASLLYDDY